MNHVCEKCVAVVGSSKGEIIILNCPVNQSENECQLLATKQQHRQQVYVPPEYRKMALLGLTSNNGLNDPGVMYMYGDPGIRGNKIYGIDLQNVTS